MVPSRICWVNHLITLGCSCHINSNYSRSRVPPFVLSVFPVLCAFVVDVAAFVVESDRCKTLAEVIGAIIDGPHRDVPFGVDETVSLVEFDKRQPLGERICAIIDRRDCHVSLGTDEAVFAVDFDTRKATAEGKCVIVGSRYDHVPLGVDETPVSYTHLRAHETRHDLVCRL